MNKYEQFSKDMNIIGFWQKELCDYIFDNHTDILNEIIKFKQAETFVTSLNIIKYILVTKNDKWTMKHITLNNINNCSGAIDRFFNKKYLKTLI